MVIVMRGEGTGHGVRVVSEWCQIVIVAGVVRLSVAMFI